MKRAWWLGLLLLGASSCEEVTGPAGYVATFEDVAGLKAGDPVYVAGVKVGRVKSVGLEEGKAKVEMLVEGQHGVSMTSTACVSVGRYAFDEETHVRLVPGKDGKELSSGDELTCVEPGDELGKRMTKVADAMAAVLEAALDGKGTIGKLLTDPKLAAQVVRFFEEGPPAPAAKEDEPDEKDEAKEEDEEGEEPAATDPSTGSPTDPAEPKPLAPAKPTKPPAPAGDLKDPFGD